jgi:hypothetical protein
MIQPLTFLVILCNTAMGGNPVRITLPPGESPEIWEDALLLAGLVPGPVPAGGPGIVVVRRAEGWQLEALDGQGGRRTLIVAPPTEHGEREDLAVLAGSLVVPLRKQETTRVVGTATPGNPSPPPAVTPSPITPVFPSSPPVSPSEPAVAMYWERPDLHVQPAGRLQANLDLRLGDHAPAPMASLLAGTTLGPLMGNVGISWSQAGLPDAPAAESSVRNLGVGLNVGPTWDHVATLIETWAEHRTYLLADQPLTRAWVPRVGARIELSTHSTSGIIPRGGIWASHDLRTVALVSPQDIDQKLSSWEAGISLGVAWDGDRR